MALAYTAPTWENGGGVGISASQLQALSDCMEGLVQGSDKAITNIAISGQTITLTFADGSEETGTASGLKGISSIAKTGTSGNVDTYTITYTDGSTSTFTVTNGADGSFYIVTAGIKSTDDPYGNIEYYIGGDFYKNGVLYNQSAFYKVTLVDETEYPPSPYLIDGSSGTFTNGHYSTGSIGGIPSGATITTQIFTDNTMATLLGEVKVLIGLQGSEGEQGPQGPAGDDGVSPEVTITTITGGHRVNITDAEHPSGQNFDVMDGHDGASDWADITNKPNFATVATSGSYNDLSNKPTIPDEVTANPQGTATGTLTKLGIGSDIYEIQGGGGGTDENAYHIGDTAETALADDDYFPFYDTSASAKRKTLWSNIKSVLSNLFVKMTAIATNEPNSTASQAYAAGEHFYKNGKFCTAKTAIASGATFTLGTNYVEGTVADCLGKKVELWTNPNPSSDFAAQTINVTLNNKYAYYLISAKLAPNRDFENWFIIGNENGNTGSSNKGIFMSTYTYNGIKFIFSYRTVVWDTNSTNKLKFEGGASIDNGVATPDNSYMIPQKVIGVIL